MMSMVISGCLSIGQIGIWEMRSDRSYHRFDQVGQMQAPTKQSIMGGKMITIDMKHCKFEIHPPLESQFTYGYQGRVVTVFPDGSQSPGTRAANNEDNIREAESQGYTGPDAVWKSLVEHEYLHSLISELLYDRPSLVLETESGRKFHPSWLRYQEEAIVIGVQYLINPVDKKSALWGATWDLVHRNSGLGFIDGFLDQCYSRVQDLWSQIEKDSEGPLNEG